MGYVLAQRGLRFRILDAGAEIGHVWRSRWDSLSLFTPAQYDNLPGLDFDAPRDTYPGKDDVADYLHAYAAKFELPIQPDTTVTSLSRSNGVYVAKASQEVFEAKQVVVATGPFHTPFVPSMGESLDPEVTQIHSAEYRRPDLLPPGDVLVVGAGNSGCQIARELSASRHVDLSVGKRIPTVPQRLLGRDLWWWGSGLGLTSRITVDSRLGRRLAEPGSSDRGWAQAARQAVRRSDPPAGDDSSWSNRDLRGWVQFRVRSDRVGDGVQGGSFVDRHPRREG